MFCTSLTCERIGLSDKQVNSKKVHVNFACDPMRSCVNELQNNIDTSSEHAQKAQSDFYRTCAISTGHLLFIHSIVSNVSVSGQRRP